MKEKNIEKIIACIDRYLEQSGQQTITPPDANKLLERDGILNDSQSRPGKPLRDLLRDKKIPHAYKVGNKWHIPHS